MHTDAKTVAEALLDVLDGTTQAHDLAAFTGMSATEAEKVLLLRSKLLNDQNNNRGIWEKNKT